MVKIIVIFLWLLGLFCTEAEDIYIRISIKSQYRKNHVFWEFYGETNLPQDTSLAAELWLGHFPVPRSSKELRVNKGAFRFNHTSSGARVLGGEYVVRIEYDPRHQQHQNLNIPRFTRLVCEENFYHTNVEKADKIEDAKNPPGEFYQMALHEGYQTHREYLNYIRTTVSEIHQFIEELKQKTESYQQKKDSVDLDAMRKWIIEDEENSMYRRYLKMRESFTRGIYPQVLAPYANPSTIDDLTMAITQIEKLWKLCLQELYTRHNLPIPPKFRRSGSGQNFDRSFAYYQHRIDRRLSKLLLREPFPENLGIVDIERDMRWFNAIYRHLVESHQKHKALFEEDTWQTSFNTTQMHLADFKERVGDYQKSRLAQRDAVVALLTTLCENGKMLAQTYNSMLRGATKIRDEQILEKLRLDMDALAKIIIDNQNQTTKEKQESRNEMERILSEFVSLEHSFYDMLQVVSKQTEQERLVNFEKWQQNYLKLLEKLDQDVEKCKTRAGVQEYFPKIVRHLSSLVRQLRKTINDYYRDIKNTTQKPHADYLKQRQLFLHQIEQINQMFSSQQ